MRCDRMTTICVTVVMTALGACHAVASESALGLPVVLPVPRHMAWAKSAAPAWLELNTIKAITAPPHCREAAGGIAQFNARLRELNRPPLDFRTNASLEPVIIHLGMAPDTRLESRVGALPLPAAEGYRLVVDQDGVFILGSDLPGLYHGLMTLRQLVDAQGRIARVAISDWPDFPLRGAYMAGKSGLKDRILQCAALKLNFMLFECEDFFDFQNAANRVRWQEAFALCRQHFIEPVPELQSFGWGQFVLAAHPGAAEGNYVDKRRFEVKDGVVQSPDPPLAPAVTIVDAGFDDPQGNPVAGWIADRQGDGVACDREGTHTGQGCLRITRMGKGTTRVWQEVRVLPQHRYELSCFLKTKGVAEGTAYIEVYGLNPDGSLGDLLAHAAGIRGDQEWQRTAAAFDSAGYTRLQIYVRLQDAFGTAWFDDVAMVGIPGMNPLSNVLITPSAPVIVQDEAGGTTHEEGKDYRLVAAPVAFPFEIGAPLRIEIPSGSRIKDPSAVLLSYHQAPPGSVTCCPSEPLYQEFMRKAIRNVIQCLKPKYLHIGHDEPRVLNRDHRCTARKLSNSQLFADDVERMRAYAREADPAIRLMMWSDAVNPYHNGPSLNMNAAAALLPKDIIQCLWWYDWPDKDSRIENSTKFFLELGFEVTGSPWFDHRNVHQWATTLHQHRQGNTHVLGEIYTSWADTAVDPWQALPTAAQYMWTVDKVPLDEFLKEEQRAR
jgi:hypothetical protein